MEEKYNYAEDIGFYDNEDSSTTFKIDDSIWLNTQNGMYDYFKFQNSLLIFATSSTARASYFYSILVNGFIFTVIELFLHYTDYLRQKLAEFLGFGDYLSEVFSQVFFTYPHIACVLIWSSPYYEEIIATSFLLLGKEETKRLPYDKIRIREFRALYAIGTTIFIGILLRPIPYFGILLAWLPLSCVYSFFSLHGKILYSNQSAMDAIREIESHAVYYFGNGLIPSFFHLVVGRRWLVVYFICYPFLMLVTSINHQLEPPEPPNFDWPIFHILDFFIYLLIPQPTAKRKTA